MIQTVTGPVPATALGITLSHEHLFSRFGDPPSESPAYPEAQVLDMVRPYLVYLRALGVATIVDCTAVGFGRAPRLLRELSRASGVQILTNTGVYGAAEDRYVPDWARTASADALAARWTREVVEGIGDSGVRPGFIKIGVDAGPLSTIDRTLVVAAARTHRQTRLTIASHTGDNPGAAGEQLALLRAEGAPASAWVWVHANACQDDAALWRAGTEGAWLGFDGLSATTYDRHLALVREAKARGLLGRVLLSHDGNSFPAPGRLPRPYDLLMTSFRYRLLDEGLTPKEVEQLLVRNPGNAWGGGAGGGHISTP
jgi:predicted metal-dependent phosphotriesterase family hydrolase